MRLLALVPFAAAVSAYAVVTFPAAKGSQVFSVAHTIPAGSTYDGLMKRFDRGVNCTGQIEGGLKDSVFILEAGATLKNAIIGKNQIEGVHCLGPCIIQNVWWEDVCEDALTLKQKSGTSKVIGGGARGAKDKIVQHNGGGKVVIDGFYANNFGKVYRSCGNCKTQVRRQAVITGLIAINGYMIAGGNDNYNDTIEIKKTCARGVKKICSRYQDQGYGAAPSELSTGPDGKVCQYRTSDISSDC